MSYEVTERCDDLEARSGILDLPSGRYDTPFFMPVASSATVKSLAPWDVPKTDVLISNAFLLHLRPGEEVINAQGGLREYMKWKGGIFTDSGGFQLIRQGFSPKITEEGVLFKSPYDGKTEMMTPEKVLEIEDKLGADVGMVLDECPPYPSSREELVASARRTFDWAVRSVKYGRKKGLTFGIVQGGTDEGLRKTHAKKMAQLDLDGFGIGGLSIGETSDEMFRSLKGSLYGLPEGKPRYFMGLGTRKDILEAVNMGVDIFDSVYPTRNARHKTALLTTGKINIGKKKYKAKEGPIEEGCMCQACRNFSFGYVNNLLRDDELLGLSLLTIHNLHVIQTFMKNMRKALDEDRFQVFYEEEKNRLN